jgi:hypothetical protein
MAMTVKIIRKEYVVTVSKSGVKYVLDKSNEEHYKIIETEKAKIGLFSIVSDDN